jgi:hypothetical protein
MTEQAIYRLLCEVGLLGQLGRAQTLNTRIAKERDMGRVEVGIASPFDAGVDAAPNMLPGQPKEASNVGLSLTDAVRGA